MRISADPAFVGYASGAGMNRSEDLCLYDVTDYMTYDVIADLALFSYSPAAWSPAP